MFAAVVVIYSMTLVMAVNRGNPLKRVLDQLTHSVLKGEFLVTNLPREKNSPLGWDRRQGDRGPQHRTALPVFFLSGSHERDSVILQQASRDFIP